MAGGRKQYLLRFPTFEDVRFLDDDNTIESDISDDEEIHLRNLIKCNGWTKINLKARSVHRLLNQYQYSSIWSPEIVRIPESYQENLLRPLSPESLTKIKKSEDHQQEDLSDLSSSSGDLSDKETSRFSRSRKMSSSKPQKRKREESSSLEESKHRNKKIAKTSSKSRISYKEPIHTLSSEESSSEESNSEQGHLVSDVNGHQSMSNNHTLSPRIGRESPDSTAGNTPKDSSSDSEVEFVEQTAQDIDNQSAQDENSVDNSQVSSTTQGDSAHLEKTFEEHVFTQKDEKEISKYSSLLDPDLVENNNMWILQCPTSMDCSGLVGQKINLNGCSRLDVGDKSYESFSHKSKDNRSATLAVPTNKNLLQLMKIPIAGNIIVEEFLDIMSDSSFSVTEGPEVVEMPDNLRTRHPLFGNNFKKQLKIAKKMERMSLQNEQINVSSDLAAYESDVSHLNSPKKKKKKKNKKKDH